MGNILSTRERYSADYERAAGYEQQLLERDPRRFLKVVDSEFSLPRAFKTPVELAQEIGYTLSPQDRLDDAKLQTEAAVALHMIWKNYVATQAPIYRGPAQTLPERALGALLDRIVDAHIATVAEEAAS